MVRWHCNPAPRRDYGYVGVEFEHLCVFNHLDFSDHRIQYNKGLIEIKSLTKIVYYAGRVKSNYGNLLTSLVQRTPCKRFINCGISHTVADVPA